MKVNRRKELFPNVTDEQWNDWKWQVKNRIETYEELSKYFTFDAEEAEGSRRPSPNSEWPSLPTT